MVQVRLDLPEDLHRKLKIKAASEGKTLQDTIIYVLRRGVS